jgi:predicted HicB family RNase H-like nuclease
MSRNPDYPSSQADQFIVRFPDGLRDEIKIAAKAAGRSMNSEIILRLQGQQSPTEEPEMTKGQTLTVRLSDETRQKLDELSVRGPYRISITSIVERGIELAAKELEALK